jgi:diadenosine tetraphosphatase ApaH/serine/threonine PP2A family protein phosphatase
VPERPFQLRSTVDGSRSSARPGNRATGNNAACYALFDSERERLTFYRVPYDHGAAIRKIRAAGLPERLAMRLERGT